MLQKYVWLSVFFLLGSFTQLKAEEKIIISPLFDVNMQTETPEPAGPISGPSTVCQNQANVLYSVSEIIGATSYVWTLPAGATGSSDSSSILISFGPEATSGNIEVYGLSPDGPGEISSLALTINPAPQVDAGIDQNIIINFQANLEGVVTGSTGPYTYLWTSSPSGALDADSTLLNPTTLGLSSNTTFCFSATDQVTGCVSNTDCMMVMITGLPLQIMQPTATAVCTNQSSHLNVQALNGSGNYTYNWAPANMIVGPANIANPVTRPITNFTNFYVTVSDGGTVPVTGGVTIVPSRNPTAAISGTQTVCIHDGFVNIRFTGNNGTPPYTFTYKINNGPDETVTTVQGNTVNVGAPCMVAGSFVYKLVSVRDNSAAGCSANANGSATVKVNAIPALPRPFTDSSSYVCQGQSNVVYTIPLDTNVFYTWNYSGTGAYIVYPSTGKVTINFAQNATSGVLSVFATSNYGCGSSPVRSMPITVKPIPSAPQPFEIYHLDVCRNQTGVQYAVPLDESVYYNWSYSGTGTYIDGSNTNTVFLNFGQSATSGNLIITATAIDGCGTSLPRYIPINVHQLPVVNAGYDETIYEGTNVTLTATPVSGSAPFQFLWSNGATGSTITDAPLASTNYTVTITDAFQCQNQDEVSVIVVTESTLTATVPTIITCPGNVTIPVSIRNLYNVGSISLAFEYDTTVLTFTGYESLVPLGFDMFNAVNNQIRYACFDVGIPINMGDFTLVNLNFTGTQGHSELAWIKNVEGSCSFTDVNGNILTTGFFNGGVTFLPCAEVTGEVNYDNSQSSPMGNTRLILKKTGLDMGTDTTDNSGVFQFSQVMAGNYLLDAQTNQPWGGANAADGLLILKHFTGTIPLSGIRLKAADVDGSGYVNSLDALKVMKRYVGMSSSFAAGDWVFDDENLSITAPGTLVHNLKALCYGDVDGSYVPGARTDPTIILSHDGSVSVGNDGLTDIPIRINEKAEIGSISLIMEIPDKNIDILNITSSVEGSLLFNTEGNLLKIAWYSLTPMLLNPGDVVMTMHCRLQQNQPEHQNWVLHETSQITDGNAIPAQYTSLYMPWITSENTGILLEQNSPNPFAEQTNIDFYLPEAGQVSLAIADVTGRITRTISIGQVERGYQQVSLQKSGLAPGLYTYTLIYQEGQNTIKQTRKMVVK